MKITILLLIALFSINNQLCAKEALLVLEKEVEQYFLAQKNATKLKHGFDLYPELLQLLKSYSDLEILHLVDTINKSKVSTEPLSEKDAFMLASLIKNLDSRHSIRICLLGLKRIPAEATYPPLAAFLYERGITAEELIKLRDTQGNSKEKIADINDILLIYKEGFFVSGSPTNDKTPLK